MEDNEEITENVVETFTTSMAVVVETSTTTTDEQRQLAENECYLILKDKYRFLDESILDNQENLLLFDACVNYIKQIYLEFDKYAKGSCIFIINKLMLHNLITEDNFRSEIDKFLNDLNINYNNYISGFKFKSTKNHFMRKFSNKYLLENYEQIYKV